LRVTLIHNPEAGDETRPTRGQLEALIKEAGHKVRYQSVKDSGWSKVLKKQADLIAVAGGGDNRQGGAAYDRREGSPHRAPDGHREQHFADTVSSTYRLRC
jgi:hypothetical protein